MDFDREQETGIFLTSCTILVVGNDDVFGYADVAAGVGRRRVDGSAAWLGLVAGSS